MQTVNLIQGSDEWLTHRDQCYNASDTPVVMSESTNRSRTEFVAEQATGVTYETHAFVKRLFDEGHTFETLARPLAEAIIGDDLYPVTGITNKFNLARPLGASFDGLTMCESTGFEHKSLNNDLREVFITGAPIPVMYTSQMEHQMMVSGAKRIIFMASNWIETEEVTDHWVDSITDGIQKRQYYQLVEVQHRFYNGDEALRARIIAGLAQCETDIAAYVPQEYIPAPKAEVKIELPALFVHASGEITTHNMKEYGEALTAKLVEVRAIALLTDQDFSNAKEAAKVFREQCAKLKLTKEAMLSQTVSIGEAARMIDAWGEDLRLTALKLEKDVEREDVAKKRAMVLEANTAYATYKSGVEAEIHPIKIALDAPDFALAIKGKRNYQSMQEAINDMMANEVIAVNMTGKDIKAKLEWCKATSAGYGFLLNDLAQIILKQMDDFQLVVTTRINQHKIDEAAKAEEQRKAMQAEADRKAQEAADAAIAKAKAEQESIIAAAVAEAAANIVENNAVWENDIATVKPNTPKLHTAQATAARTKQSIAKGIHTRHVTPPRPPRAEIVNLVASGFGVSHETSLEWLIVEFS